MLNYLWAGMLAAGIIWAAFHGRMDAVTAGMLDSARDAVTLSITMLGVMSFWCGILKIGENAGLVRQLSEKMKPVLRFLFPDLPEDHPAAASISMNMIANFLGLGWAATPAGLRAMKELLELEEERRAEDETVRQGESECRQRPAGAKQVVSVRHGRKMYAAPRGTASNEMCTFLILNISSLQLIPVSIIAYRAQYGSANPTAIVGPAIAATAVSTLVAVIFCKVMGRKRRI